MRQILTLTVIFLWCQYTSAQTSGIITEITTDTILLGNTCEVKYTVQNLEANFEAPEFDGLKIASGPNVSTSMQFINGKMTSSQAFSYVLYPEEIGEFYISPAYFNAQDTVYETPPIAIMVLPNPDNIRQRKRSFKVVDDQLSAIRKKPEDEKTILKKKKKRI